ncbi:MAG TPA: NUDIX hydrolase [Spirochaetia bacterium]|nr:NUDIX hydrolase [Spirochaetia bacterium]
MGSNRGSQEPGVRSQEAGDDRRYPGRPLLGIGALVFRREGGGLEILLVERGKDPLKGLWSLPGGLLEVGEKLADGIRREVREETGIEIEVLSLFEIFERIMPDAEGRAEYHYVLIDYLCRVTGGALEAASDVSAVAWVRRDQLRDYRITDGTLAVVERAFESGSLA